MSGGIQKIFRQDNQPFTMVPNELIRDPEITPNAFRLLSYLMSHENGYEITYGQIERQTGLGRYAINEAVKLLGEKGWLEVARTKVSNGQFGPKAWFIKSPTSVGHSTMEQPHMGEFHSGTAHGHKEEHLLEKKTNKEEHSKELNTRFSEFWDIYPRKVGREQAKRLFIQSESQLEEMMDGVRRLAADPNLPEKQFIPHPATWLRRCGWLDEPYPERHERRTNAEKAMDLVRYYEAQEQGEIES
jgi:hypothetical protein